MMGTCLMCRRYANLEQHHIFGGPYRKKSDRYGLVVGLCHWCHNEPPEGVHHNAANMMKLRQYGQRKAMKEQGWTVEEFISQFGKNYL